MMKTKTSKLDNHSDLGVDFENVKKAYFAFRAMNHKTRQKIMLLIHKKKKISVSDIYHTLKLEQSQTSMYLAVMRKANLVIAKREGQSVLYSLNYTSIAAVDKSAKYLREGCKLT